MRGIDLVTAATIAAETGDMGRFPTSRAYMSLIGIMPSEHSSGDSMRRGKITKTGNIHLRFILIETARHYAHKAAITRTIKERQEGVPKAILDCAWNAQKRLCRRFLTLLMRGKHKNVIAVAIARELAAFVWAITRKVQMAA